jgi:hypothetical protein
VRLVAVVVMAVVVIMRMIVAAVLVVDVMVAGFGDGDQAAVVELDGVAVLQRVGAGQFQEEGKALRVRMTRRLRPSVGSGSTSAGAPVQVPAAWMRMAESMGLGPLDRGLEGGPGNAGTIGGGVGQDKRWPTPARHFSSRNRQGMAAIAAAYDRISPVPLVRHHEMADPQSLKTKERPMRRMTILAASAALMLGPVAAVAQTPAEPPMTEPPTAATPAPQVQAVNIVSLDELAETDRTQIDAAVAAASETDRATMRSSIDAHAGAVAALQAEGLTSQDVVAASSAPDGSVTLIVQAN